MKKNPLVSCLGLILAASAPLSAEILFVAGYGSGQVYYIDTDIDFDTIAGSVSVGVHPPFMSPFGIATHLATGIVYVCDRGNGLVYEVVSDMMGGYMVNNTIMGAVFSDPVLAAFTPSGSTALVTDYDMGNGNGKVFIIDVATHTVTSEVSPGGFNGPIGVVAIDESTAYVADQANVQVYIVDIPTSSIIGTVMNMMAPAFSEPTDVAISSTGDFVVLTDYNGGALYKINTATHMVSNVFMPQPFMNTDAVGLSPNDTLGFVTEANSPVSGNVYAVDPLNATTFGAVMNGFTAFGGMTGIAFLQDNPIAYTGSLTGVVYKLGTSAPYSVLLEVANGIGAIGSIRGFQSSQPTTVLPARNFGGSQSINDFGVVYAYFNSLAWEASLSPTVVGYNIYRNGIKIASVSSTTFQYADSDIPKGSAFEYSVRAFNASGVESAPVSVTVR